MRVGLHDSCSMVRGLGLSEPSEVMGEPFNKAEDLLRKVRGLTLVPLDRVDECCGFGGTFCVTHEACRRVNLTGTSYGCFVAGPSATGDIEGVIVHGAQGPRSLSLFFLARTIRAGESRSPGDGS